MKKHYQNPKMNLVEIDEWQSVICTSPSDGITVTNSDYDADDTGGFSQEKDAPRRNGLWDE